MKTILLITAFFLLSLTAFAQNTQPTPPEPSDDVVKISSELVQIDAVITDKKGNQIKDLTIDDIEILQDGKPQTIVGLSYVNREIEQTLTTIEKKRDKNTPLPPPTVSRFSNLGRVLTFVVDDGNCGVTTFGMKAAKEGLEKFVTEQMQPNDLVAIYQTRSGSSLFQQYTSDKSRLLSIIRKIRWYPPAGGCSINGEEYEREYYDSTLKKEGAQSFLSDKDLEKLQDIRKFADDRNTSGVIGVLRYAIKGLERIGGRKTLFLMTDGLPISDGKSQYFNSYTVVRDLTELANRASVVINPIDVRGLTSNEASAYDNLAIKQKPTATEDSIARRQSSNDSRQSGLFYAANETGGTFYKNMNNLDYPIQEVLKVEKGYYLISYEPEDDTFKGKKFNKIEIRLKNPDLKVSSRTGFSSFTDNQITPKSRTGDGELYEAIVAPLPTAGLNLHLTAFFANTPKEGSFVKSLIYIDGKQITFTDDSKKMKKAVFDIIAVTLNSKNEVVDELNRTHTIRIPVKSLEEVQKNGLIYSANVPVKKAGVYNFRVAVRDTNSKMVGSAGQQIDVPNLEKDDIYVSGLTIGEIAVRDNKPILPKIIETDDEFSTVSTLAVPAIRKFSTGSVLGYSYKIYNAKLDKAKQKPNLTTQVILYNDGKIVSDSEAQPSQLDPQDDLKRIFDYGYLKLPPTTSAGDYALQIIVKDLLTKEVTSQWIDFEVIQ